MLEPLPLLELGFWDMTDALQGASVVDEPLGVLKQGIANRVGHGELMGN